MLPKLACNCRHIGTIAIALILGAISTSSNAAAFRTRWDPQFSLAFSAFVGETVFWEGLADITVPNAGTSGCLDANDVFAVPSQCSATLDLVTVSFYNTSNSVVGQIEWPFPNPITSTLTQLSAWGGDVNGMTLATPLTGIASILSSDYFVNLSFGLGTVGETPTAGLPFLTLQNWNGEGTSGPIYQSYPNDQSCLTEVTLSCVPRVEWTRIPEPSSLALIGAALMMLVLARRRIA